MKKSLGLAVLAACASLTISTASATTYDITFSGIDSVHGENVSASGWLNVNNSGQAVSGVLDVTLGDNAGPLVLELGSYGGNWAPGILFASDYDNAIQYVSANDFLGSTHTLSWVDNNATANIEFQLWQNYPGSFNLWGYASSQQYLGQNSSYNPNYYDPQAIGSATLTAVPDGGMTVALLGGALVGLGALRRKLFC